MRPSQQIEIEVPFPYGVVALFETDTIKAGMSHAIPGGVLRLEPIPMQRTQHFATLAPIIVTIGKDIGTGVASGLLAAYIYDKLTDGGQKKQGRNGLKLTIRVNHKETEVTPDGIRRAIEESIEIEIESKDE